MFGSYLYRYFNYIIGKATNNYNIFIFKNYEVSKTISENIFQ